MGWVSQCFPFIVPIFSWRAAPVWNHALGKQNLCCCCPLTQVCFFCNLMACTTPGFPVIHYCPEFAQTLVHWVDDAIQPSHPSLIPFYHLQSFPASGSFQMRQLFTTVGQIGTSASVLTMNIQGWFPLGLTGLISLQSKGLSRVLSSTTVRKQVFSTQPFLLSSSHIHTWLLEKPYLRLYGPLLEKWCFCFLICCLGLRTT